MKISFDMGHVFNRYTTDLENACALRPLLDCLIRINLAYLKLVRQSVPSLYQSGVRYDRTEIWDPIPALYKRGYGDCKSLSAALISQYIRKGIKAEPVFRFAHNSRGGNDFHILVHVPKANGIDAKHFEDPSRKLGMGKNEVSKFY